MDHLRVTKRVDVTGAWRQAAAIDVRIVSLLLLRPLAAPVKGKKPLVNGQSAPERNEKYFFTRRF